MKTFTIIVGLFVLADCYYGNVAKVATKVDELKQILQTFERAIKKETDRVVRKWLKRSNDRLRITMEQMSLAEYNYETDISDSNAKRLEMASSVDALWHKWKAKEAKLKLKRFHKDLSYDTKRQLRLMSSDSDPADPKIVKNMQDIKSTLVKIYAKGTVKYNGTTYNLDPDLNNIMSNSRDPAQLEWAWKNWRDVSGKLMPDLYTQLVEYLNIGALDNDYKDAGDAMRQRDFDETPNLIAMAENLWKELKPMYIQLHTYVRKRLREYYSKKGYKFPDDGSIPAHLLGNMWAQEWQNIYDIVKPYPEIKEENYDAVLKQDYNVGRMFRRAEEFYTSIGLFNMTDDFWKRSMFIRPPYKDRKVQCHASAFDFYTENKFRIKMCTEVNMENFETIHHEMGHIEYFMSYRHLPTVYRDGANCGFHEAIGDTAALSVHTRRHLRQIGILTGSDKTRSPEETLKVDINYLMRKALYKVAFLPFGYLVDKWRWNVFSGKITQLTYNEEWWKLRLHYQGVTSPVPRSDMDFDPGAKFHIPANSPYMCYFVSFIIQFQFYESLCKASGYDTDKYPLYQCDFYESKEAGRKLKSMLEMGKSRPWKDAMEKITGQREVSTSAIKTYFQPLIDWLQEENKNETPGWDDAKINWQSV